MISLSNKSKRKIGSVDMLGDAIIENTMYNRTKNPQRSDPSIMKLVRKYYCVLKFNSKDRLVPNEEL